MSIEIFKGELFTDKNEAIGTLSYKQRMAVEGYVAFNMENAKTKAQKKFQAYVILANAPRQASYPIQEALTSYLDEKDIFCVYKYIENKAIPMQLWSEKTKDDLKEYKVKNALPSVFVNYCDLLTNGDGKACEGDYRLALYLCRDILQDSTLEKLHEVCNIIISSIAEEVGYGTKIESTIFIDTNKKGYQKDLELVHCMDFCINMIRPMNLMNPTFENIMSTLEDNEAHKELSSMELKEEDMEEMFEGIMHDSSESTEEEIKEDIDFCVNYLKHLGYPAETVDKCLKKVIAKGTDKTIREIINEKKVYVVSKVSKSIDKRVVSTVEFDTLKEAEKYIDTLDKNFPDIAESFDFRIDVK